MTRKDLALGMGCRITRRDFLNGMAIGAGGAMAGRWLSGGGEALFAQEASYPPALTGLRGSHVGSFEILHQLRDPAAFWKTAGSPSDTGEEYDLVVVGAGISGLTAAYSYRKARPAARILVLDNHDDFGGHAKRNEFSYGGRTYIGYGGTQSIDSPAPYSSVAKGLITELGIDVAGYGKALDSGLYKSLGLRSASFFDKETFGADRLVVGDVRDEAFRSQAPFSDAVKRDLGRLLTEKRDPMPGLSMADKKARLARMTYKDFVVKELKLDEGVLWPFQTRTHGLFGVGIDAVPAQDAFALGLPGFQGMGLDDKPGPGQNYDSIRSEEAEDYYFHFPDGNASVARLLARRLVPGAIPGSTAADLVTTRADYAKLDAAGAPVRIRLSAPVLRVRHVGPAGGDQRVEVTYASGPNTSGPPTSAPGATAGRQDLKTVRARGAVLACWHTVIPAICPELPATQKTAMDYAIKVPLVYTNVFIRNWTAFQKLGVQRVSTPSMFHTSFGLDFPVSVGAYKHQTDPQQPIVLHLSKAACKPGLPTREQHRAGRRELLSTPFTIIERNIREQLGRSLSEGGFDPSRDVLGITVNRWPHGYAYQYNSLEDAFWLNGGEQPCAVARRPFGRITIANSDSAAYAYTDAAIDHGHRAATELLNS
ncbi:MAG TPA: NAD(P)-binding protein [Vicinamibacterales bacterium]|nr:NAD(P)-binding protein [Vicinamibacterales bacterium]